MTKVYSDLLKCTKNQKVDFCVGESHQSCVAKMRKPGMNHEYLAINTIQQHRHT